MIDLLPSEEQQQIVESIAEFTARSLTVDHPHSGSNGGIPLSDDLWREIAALGWFGLGLPQEAGGAGFSLLEEMLLARELGRCVASPSLLAAMLGAHAAGSAGAIEVRDEILSGELRVALVSPVKADAHCFHLFDATAESLLLVWSRAGIGLYDHTAFGDRREVVSLDEAVLLQRGTLSETQQRAWIAGPESTLQRRAALLVAAQLVGVTEAARDMAVEYAKTRQQFGQPIGAFQALKHRCADMEVQAELAYAQTFFAGLVEMAEEGDAVFQMAAARVLAGEAALNNARANIQIHGGIGFTAECKAHRYLKRAHLLRQLGGEPRSYRSLLRNHAPSLARE